MTERTLVIDTKTFLEADVPEVIYSIPKGARSQKVIAGRTFVELADGKLAELRSDVRPAMATPTADGKIDRSSYYGR